MTTVLAAAAGHDDLTRAYAKTARDGASLIGDDEHQRQDDTIRSPRHGLPGVGWRPVSQTPSRVPVEADVTGAWSEINRYVIEQGVETQLVIVPISLPHADSEAQAERTPDRFRPRAVPAVGALPGHIRNW
jgi:hypothetical protein